MSTMPLSLKSKQFTSSVNGTCESLWIMLRRISKVQISKDQNGKDSAQGNGRQSCAGEVEGCMLSHDYESRGSFPWVWWCFSCSPLSLIFTAEDCWEQQFSFGHSQNGSSLFQMEKLGKVNNNNYVESREKEGEMIVHGEQGLLKHHRTDEKRKSCKFFFKSSH